MLWPRLTCPGGRKALCLTLTILIVIVFLRLQLTVQRRLEMNPHVFPGTVCIVRLPRRPILGEREDATHRCRTGAQIARAMSFRLTQQFGEPWHVDSTRVRVGFDRRARMAVAR